MGEIRRSQWPDLDLLQMRAAAATPPASKGGETAGGTGLSATAGWINVVVAAVIMLATLPGRTQGLGLITEPMLRDLQLDRVTYANINLWATLLGAAICLPIGRLFDRFGLRGATVAITLLLGAVVWTMSWLAGGASLLFLLVLATRALGQSALSVASITAVGKSFDRRVGVAMGVYSVLLSVLFAAAFIAVGSSVRINGWRTAWAQVAFGLILFAAPVTLLLRERLTSAIDRTGRRRRGPVCRWRPRSGRRRSGYSAARRRCSGWCRPGWASSTRPCSRNVASISRPTYVSGRNVDHRPCRPDGLRLADPAMVDAAAARHRDVHAMRWRWARCRCCGRSRISGSSPS